MSSKVTQEKYDLVKIEKLKHFLESNQQTGKPKYYEIFVDNLKVVDKTSDPALFDDYLVYMGDDTRMVKVLIYTSTETSPRNDKFIYTVRDAYQEKKQEELNGLEISDKINTAISQERNRSRLEFLEKELEETKASLVQCEEYKDETEEKYFALQQEFEAYKKQKVKHSEKDMGSMIGFAADYFIKTYPELARKTPIISTLSGILSGAEGLQQQMPGLETSADQATGSHVTFSKKNNPNSENELNQHLQARLHFLTQMEAAFTEPQMEKVIEIIQGLMASPDQVDTVHALIITNHSTK